MAVKICRHCAFPYGATNKQNLIIVLNGDIKEAAEAAHYRSPCCHLPCGRCVAAKPHQVVKIINCKKQCNIVLFIDFSDNSRIDPFSTIERDIDHI